MLYLENRKQSAELLRLAIPRMEQQLATFAPPSYCVWYEHLAGTNPALSLALEGLLSAGKSLTDQDVRTLHAQYVTGRDIETFQQAQSNLNTVVQDVVHEITLASAATTEIGAVLETTSHELAGALSPDLAHQRLDACRQQVEALTTVIKEHSQKILHLNANAATVAAAIFHSTTVTLRDALTGLPNRHAFERALEGLRGSPDTQRAAFLLVDVDYFKAINDTYGHLIGDKVLRAIGTILLAQASAGYLCARLGGEEFVVILTNTSGSQAIAVGERIREQVAQILISHRDGTERRGQVTVSIGVAIATDDDTPDTLYDRADQLMYTAKQAGRNQVLIADKELPLQTTRDTRR